VVAHLYSPNLIRFPLSPSLVRCIADPIPITSQKTRGRWGSFAIAIHSPALVSGTTSLKCGSFQNF
jgi:hypothetical protein